MGKRESLVDLKFGSTSWKLVLLDCSCGKITVTEHWPTAALTCCC